MLKEEIGLINVYVLGATMLNFWHVTCHLTDSRQCSSEFGFAHCSYEESEPEQGIDHESYFGGS
jgi:hypothetical protein